MGRLESTVANVARRFATQYHSPTGRWTAWGDGVGLLDRAATEPAFCSPFNLPCAAVQRKNKLEGEEQ